MAEPEDLDDLLVRLVGDSSNLERTLADSNRSIKQWQGDIEGTVRGPQQDLDALSDDVDDVGDAFERTGVGMAFFAAQAAVIGGVVAAVVFLVDAWRRVVEEVEDADRAITLFGDDAASVRGAVSEVERLVDAWRELQRQAAVASAPLLTEGAGFLAGVLEDVSKAREAFRILRELEEQVEENGLLGVNNVARGLQREREEREAAARRLRMRELTEDIEPVFANLEGQLDRLQLELGEITEFQVEYNKLIEAAGVNVGLLTDEQKENLKTMVEEILAARERLEVMKEEEKTARRIARERERELEAASRRFGLAEGRRADQLGGFQADLDRLGAERDALQGRLDEILQAGTFSAGAFVAEGTPQARTLTQFGTAQDALSGLLKDLNKTEKQILKAEEKQRALLEKILENSAPAPVTIQNLAGVA